MSKAYEQEKQALKDEQSSKSYDEIKEQLQKQNEFLVELDRLVPQEHVWIDRGEVMSCEGAAHPNHRSFKSHKGKRA
jgi:hypothetical protein